MPNPIQYIKETKQELKHVSWPSRRQAVGYTIIVVILSFVTAFYLGFFDYVLTTALGKFVV